MVAVRRCRGASLVDSPNYRNETKKHRGLFRSSFCLVPNTIHCRPRTTTGIGLCEAPDLESPDGRPLLPANIYGHGFQSHMRKRLLEAAHQSIRFRVVFLRQESCVAPQPHDLQRQRPRPLCPVRTRSTIEWNWVNSQLLRQMDCSLHYNLCSL